MTTPLFSTYRQGENRVTHTFLAVLQRLSLLNIDRILEALLGDNFNLVTFDNQPKGKGSTPDAKIGTGSAIWIETKTSRNAVRCDQIEKHLKSLRDGESLLLLTPDDDAPIGLHDRVVWSNFRTLSETIGAILDDENEPPSEKEAFLLREFISMLRHDGLIGPTEPRVMVVAAKWAWPMYKLLSVYRCSPNKPMRSFRDSDHIAFYVSGKIQQLVPRIKSVIESIEVTQQEQIASLDGDQKELAEELSKKIDQHRQGREFGKAFKVMFLSQHDDVETVELSETIINDKNDKNGNPVTFTYGQPRYVTLESLRTAGKTSELVLC